LIEIKYKENIKNKKIIIILIKLIFIGWYMNIIFVDMMFLLLCIFIVFMIKNIDN